MDKIGALGCLKSPPDNRDFIILQLLSEVMQKPLPDIIDYRDEMPPITNQGNEGSCTGQAAKVVKEWQEGKELDLIMPEDYLSLSARYIYELAKVYYWGDKKAPLRDGADLRSISKALIKKGICEEKYWPYEAKKLGKPEAGAYQNALKYRVKEPKMYFRITDVEDLKYAMHLYGPIEVGLTVYKNWHRARNGEIPDSTICERAYGVLGGHAVAFCSWHNSIKMFTFQNSWGDWGDRGFGYLSEREVKRSMLDAAAWVDLPNDMEEQDLLTVGDLPERERRKIWRA